MRLCAGSRSIILSLAAAAVLVAGMAAGAAPASAFVENTTDNPVTAAPPVSRPPTPHCTVILADQFPSNAPDGTPQDFSGTLSPPPGCPGPWAKVVLGKTISVSGRQFDRVDDLIIGNAEVYRGTTEEPSGPVPTTYHIDKDITDFTALLRTPQPFHGGIGNYVTSVYTGNYLQTVTITYYQADRRHPAPQVPDAVIGWPYATANPAGPTVHFPLTDLPRNITRAYLQVTQEGHGCDEQWFTDVPDDVSAKYPSAGLCGHGPYREATAAIDGHPVGSAVTFPHIYSGGIVPTLWRPIPAIDTFDLHAETIDVTPFAGLLVDGASHDLSFTVANVGDDWDVIATLFLYTDHHAAQTSGALLTDDVAPVAAQQTAESPLSGGGTNVLVTAQRDDVTAGYVDTSAGRIYTQVNATMSYRNSDDVTAGGLAQQVVQSDNGARTSVSTRHGTTLDARRHSYSYPITVDYSAANYVNDQNFSLSGTVDMTMNLRDETRTGQRWHPVRQSSEAVDSYGILARTNGATTESDGHSTSHYFGTDDLGRWYVHLLASNHGRVTLNLAFYPRR